MNDILMLIIGILIWVFLLIILPKWIEKAEKNINKKYVSIYALRKTPKLLNFYKGLRTLKKILWKTFLFILMAVGIIIIIIIICHLWGWICENPLWVIAILLFLNLIK